MRTYVAPLERGGNKKLRALATNHLNNECAKIEKAILKYLKKGRSRGAGSVYEKVRRRLKLSDAALIRAVGWRLIGNGDVRVVSDWKIRLGKRPR